MAHVSFPVDETRWPRPLGKPPDNRVVWDTTDGPTSTTKWRIIVGKFAGDPSCYLGPWIAGNAGGKTNTLNIILSNPPPPGQQCHIRAQYYIPGDGRMRSGVTSQFWYYP